MVCAEGASAFVISDIRVEGLMRTEPGTVFSHLPFRTGDEYTPDMGTRAIHSLYRSGLFKDVSLSQDGDVLVVHIVERPAVATIETHGIKAFDKDAVETSLRDVGMAEGRIFDQATLDRADQELRRQYLARQAERRDAGKLENILHAITLFYPKFVYHHTTAGSIRQRYLFINSSATFRSFLYALPRILLLTCLTLFFVV